ncbi:S41 family peptidase [Ichthyenterobacterium sp. W332]|uniref:S41 family peptidase n=1 Tax=Microcosmobacter mediterraneus TaxID=3075607 RepID=A0ABU2YNV7_9FLAO|nr:S41 family peptidase [Ichthyenterobacterium sp. W332]MDT0558748.1 S41 family peptidase [Ichthyenterobacterium sp. W332]
MKKLLILLTLSIVVLSCGSIEHYNEAVTKMHPVEDLHEDIDKVYKQLKRLHPRLYQFTPKETLDYKFDSLKSAINRPMTSRTFHKELAKVTKFVGQGHMSVSIPNTKFTRKEQKERLKLKFDVNNLNFEYVEDKIIIRSARGNDSLLVNAEVLEVNGENALGLLKKYKTTVASDGYNTTFHDRVVGYRFLGYYQQDNGRFDSITFKLRNPDSTFYKTYKRVSKVKKRIASDSIKADSVAKIKFKDTLTRAERKAKKKARKLKSKERFKKYKKYGYNYVTKQYNRNLSFIGKDSTVALLKITSFTRGSKYKDFYEETFATLDSLGTKDLVIDLRNNFGGRLNEILALYSYLTDKNFTLINKSETNSRIPILKTAMSNTTTFGRKLFVGVLSPIILTYDLLRTSKKDGQLYYRYKAAKETEPNPLNFKGNIYVLINGNSFSASSIISTQLKGDKRAMFIGEETGGAYNGTVAGYYKIYELPNTKLRARIGLMHIDSKHKIAPDGYGVKPDVEITPTYQDRLNNKDPELEWVLNAIEKKN